MENKMRLIELLDTIHHKPLGKTYQERIETIADFLIANGVTVKPTFVGETVYGFWDVSEYETRANNKRYRNIQIKAYHHLDWALKYGAVEIRSKQCTKTDMLVFGKLTFLTYGEAEKALAERRAVHEPLRKL